MADIIENRFPRIVTTNSQDNSELNAGGGSGAGVMRIESNSQTMALDKTWQEISDCFTNGGYAYIAIAYGPSATVFMPVTGVANPGRDAYFVAALVVAEEIRIMQFTCSSPDEYPVFDDGK